MCQIFYFWSLQTVPTYTLCEHIECFVPFAKFAGALMIIETSSSWSQGVCCQAGQPEFDPQVPQLLQVVLWFLYIFCGTAPSPIKKNKTKKENLRSYFSWTLIKANSVWRCTAHVKPGLLASLGINNKLSSRKRRKEMSRKMRIGSLLCNSPLTWQELVSYSQLFRVRLGFYSFFRTQ